VQDRLGEAGAVTVSLGKGIDALMHDVFEEAHLDGAIDGALFFVAAQTAELGSKGEEAVDGHVCVGRGILGEIADHPFGGDGIIDDIMSAHGDFAGGGGYEAGDHAHGGGLSCAVGAEEAEHLAALNGEGNAVHGPL